MSSTSIAACRNTSRQTAPTANVIASGSSESVRLTDTLHSAGDPPEIERVCEESEHDPPKADTDDDPDQADDDATDATLTAA
jgi:hypothetical protein